jgi:methyl-accepting chemotaxis protein
MVFGSLVALLAIMAICGLWSLYGILQGLDHMNTEGTEIMDRASQLSSLLTTVEIDLYELRVGERRHLDPLIDHVESLKRLSAEIGEHYVVGEPAMKEAYQRFVAEYPAFENHISSLATAQDADLARWHATAALSRTMSMRRDAREIQRQAWEHGRREQRELAARFRWIVLGMALGGMLVINASIMVLLRAAGMVLNPVDQLVEAGRRLSDEQFDYRARLDQNDEFSELADVYNALAERMQSNERRIMETLGQMGLTLNHELNNAIAGVELQLQVLGRRNDDGEKFEACMRQIRDILRCMAETVESLKHIRRVVLTDYVGGAKMLDLKRSVQAAPEETRTGSGADSETAV